MKIFNEPFPHIGGPFVASIGKFDGVHIGHRLILGTLLEEGRRLSAASVAYSFEPRNGTPRLTTAEEKRELFAELGVDSLISAELGDAVMTMTAGQFVERLSACGQLRSVAVGQSFRFGRGAAGDVELLRALGARRGFSVHAIEPVEVEGRAVSSTWIRECVKSGDMERAARLLGREYALCGEVVRGRRLGRRLGFRTANLLPPPMKVMPPWGVYAAWVDTAQGSYPAMTNIGVRPTVGGEGPTVESHLIGFEGELYGETIAVRLVKKIRDEVEFESLDRLARQLDEDKALVTGLLLPGAGRRHHGNMR